MSNVDAAGAAQAKTGENREALDRAAGMSATKTACESKTRSGHPATAVNNKWQDTPCGYDEGSNMRT